MSSNAQTAKIDHVWTEEPNAIKLRTDNLLIPMGESRGYERSEDAVESPLATKLFAVDGVLAVELGPYEVKATLHDDADWDALGKIVEAVLKEHVESGDIAVTGLDPATPKKKYSFGFKQMNGRPKEEQMRIVQELFEKEVNPAVAAHGGHFRLIDIQDNRVFVELGGGCQGCGMANETLKQGVEGRLREVLPEMEALIDTTDHASGNNPYYQP